MTETRAIRSVWTTARTTTAAIAACVAVPPTATTSATACFRTATTRSPGAIPLAATRRPVPARHRHLPSMARSTQVRVHHRQVLISTPSPCTCTTEPCAREPANAPTLATLRRQPPATPRGHAGRQLDSVHIDDSLQAGTQNMRDVRDVNRLDGACHAPTKDDRIPQIGPLTCHRSGS